MTAAAPGILRPFLNRFSHITINVSDLDRSVAFYQKVFPVSPIASTGGDHADLRSLGLEDGGRFRGSMLFDESTFRSRGIHLVEWERPTPVGQPYYEATSVGLFRTCGQTDDIDHWYDVVTAEGARTYGPPRSGTASPVPRPAFVFLDPDGTALEWITWYEGRGAPPNTLFHVNANCTDMQRSFHFYRDVLGLDPIRRIQPRRPQRWDESPPLGPPTDEDLMFDAVFFGIGADNRNPLDLLEWTSPKPVGKPYQSPFNLGIVRMAFEVTDVAGAVAALALAGIPASEPEPWNFGELGTRSVSLFTDPDGITIELMERGDYEWESDPRRSEYRPVLD